MSRSTAEWSGEHIVGAGATHSRRMAIAGEGELQYAYCLMKKILYHYRITVCEIIAFRYSVIQIFMQILRVAYEIV